MTDISVAAVSSPAAGVSGRIAESRTRLADNYETFLALLTTQLRNQDPLAPMDSNQFTQQIVQMTGVEQQLLTNDLLQSLVDRDRAGVTDGVGYIGRTVVADSGAARLSGGTATFSYQLPSAAAEATLQVRDSAGRLVWGGPATKLTAGTHDFVWDGSTTAGPKAPDGAYTLSVTATNAAGDPIAASGRLRGLVTGVETRDGAVILTTTRGDVPLTSVVGVAATPTA